jgi:hypothetical protein
MQWAWQLQAKALLLMRRTCRSALDLAAASWALLPEGLTCQVGGAGGGRALSLKQPEAIKYNRRIYVHWMNSAFRTCLSVSVPLQRTQSQLAKQRRACY